MKVENVDLKFDYLPGILLQKSNITVLPSDAKDFDASLTIRAHGIAGGTNYGMSGAVPNAPGGFYYTAARLSGEVLFEKEGQLIFRREFSKIIEPPKDFSVYEQSGRSYKEPSDAPFQWAYYDSYPKAMIEMISELFGYDYLESFLNYLVTPDLHDKDNVGLEYSQQQHLNLTRRAALEALTKIRSTQALPAFWVAAQDEENSDGPTIKRLTSIKAIGEIGSDPCVVDLLILFLEEKPSWFRTDNKVDVRIAAAEALGKTSDQRAIAPLEEALGDNNSLVREAARKSLGAIKSRQSATP